MKPTSWEYREPIPNAYRVENVLEAQLHTGQKKEIKCLRRGRRHRGWFESPWMKQSLLSDAGPLG